MLTLIYTALFLSCVATASAVANNSYDNCLQLTAKFARTLTNGPVADIRMTTGVNVTCSQLSNVSCPGQMINGVCTYQQKLALTCINGSTVRIRVQSNGLPRRCSLVPLTARIVELNIDFEVNFNPDVSVNSPVQSPTNAADVSKLLCNITNHASVPATSNFVKNTTMPAMDVIAGVAVDGVSIFNVNSANLVDPFFPNPTSYEAEGADQCLSHPGGGGELHYHVASGCMVNPPPGNLTGCGPDIQCLNNVANYSVQMFSSNQTLTVIGIAKDGHIIYGPYLSSGVRVTSGFDVCNGMFYDSVGNYGYFATSTYPYVTGCFGPGNYPDAKPNCTTNPAAAYTKSTYAASFTTSSSTTAATVSSTVGSMSSSISAATSTIASSSSVAGGSPTSSSTSAAMAPSSSSSSASAVGSSTSSVAGGSLASSSTSNAMASSSSTSRSANSSTATRSTVLSSSTVRTTTTSSSGKTSHISSAIVSSCLFMLLTIIH